MTNTDVPLTTVRTPKHAWPWVVLALFVVYTLWLAWVGWLDSDDHRHVDGGLGWMREFPYLPQHHGEFRHLITLPMGLLFRVFGVSETTLILPQLAYYAATLLLTYYWLARRFGEAVGLLSVLIMAALPVFAIQATVVYSDITELFFVVAALFLFISVRNRPQDRLSLIVAGMAAGCAWLTRETTVALLLTYGVLFLAGWGIARPRYFLMAAGFLLVLVAEAAFMYAMTGDPLHRYVQLFSARQGFSYRGEVQGELFDGIGNVHVSRWMDPLLSLYVNHEFGILFVALLPALVWLFRNPRLPGDMVAIARIFALLGALWFLASAAMLANMHPRYFTVTAYCGATICALWIVYGLWPRAKALAIGVAAALILGGIASIYVDNRNPLMGERGLKELVSTQVGIVHTDPETARRAGFLLQIDGLEQRVSTASPERGSIYFYNPNRERDLKGSGKNPRDYMPRTGWTKIWERQEPERFSGVLLRRLGLAERIHPSIFRRLSQPNRPVAAYRVGE